MNNKIHFYGSYYLGNPMSFRSLVPEKGEDQIHILIINHSIVLSFASSLYVLCPLSTPIPDFPCLGVWLGSCLFFTITSARAPLLHPTVSTVLASVEMREKMGKKE